MTTIDLQPTLRGENLLLRPLRAEDYEALYKAASDPQIWAQHSDTERWTPSRFKIFFEDNLKSAGCLVIIDSASGEIIGSSRYYDWLPEIKTLTVGYSFLMRRYWGGAANRELKALMLAHAFQFARCIRFQVSPENLRSQKALSKIGAQLAFEEEARVFGQPCRRLVFEITEAQAKGSGLLK
jgi:RimJ/RimL family protein N-acetyltransferase